jgi:hypothetical protein
MQHLSRVLDQVVIGRHIARLERASCFHLAGTDVGIGKRGEPGHLRLSGFGAPGEANRSSRQKHDARAKVGEPGGNRTHNPRIKSPIWEAKTPNIRMILGVGTAECGSLRHIDASQTQPDFTTALSHSSGRQ